jgi:hypothetical protein
LRCAFAHESFPPLNSSLPSRMPAVAPDFGASGRR